jgi:salicylate synthase
MEHFQEEVKISGTFDPLLLATHLAGSGLFDEYVVYERNGEWWFAADAIGRVVLDAHQVRARWMDDERATPVTDRPLDDVRSALDGFPTTRWTAFGWLAFEFAYLATGHDLGRDAVLHVMVPRTEIRLGIDHVVVRTCDPELVDHVRELVRRPLPVPSPPSAPVPVDGEGRAEYERSVRSAIQDIRDGRLQKVILSRQVPIDVPVDLTGTYLHGRRRNNPARSFLLDLGGWRALGFSPETVVEATPDGAVATQPLAGTRARGLGDDVDTRLRSELLSDEKEIFEHAISVKIAYDELLSICTPWSVAVTEFMAVKPRGSVQHLGSRVGGQLAPGRTAWDALAALVPGVTASGVPKPAAVDRIAELESRPRGMYAGAVLMADSDGSLDAALVLRALYERDGAAWLRAGAGIVSASDPAREYEETCEKLRSIAPHVRSRPEPVR